MMNRKVQHILVGALVLLGMACSTANTVAPAQDAPGQIAKGKSAASATTLTTIRSELTPDPRLVLQTTEPPAFTSYRPQSDVFVVDLPRVVKASDLEIPTNLPGFIASISAEEVIELGAPLTRVTVRFMEPMSSTVGALDGAVVISFDEPASAVAAAVSEDPIMVEEVDDVIAVDDIAPEEAPSRVAESRPVQALPKTPAAIPTSPARNLTAVEYEGAGAGLSVLLRTDGRNDYNTFALDNPLRLVVDLKGVVNRVKGGQYSLSDPFVKQIRVAQFASEPDPVSRVVLDLSEMPEYSLSHTAEGLKINFGSSQEVASISRPAKVEIKPVAEKPVQVASSQPETPSAAPRLEPIAAEHVVHAPQQGPAPPQSPRPTELSQQRVDETQSGVIRSTLRAEPVEDVFGTQSREPISGGNVRQPGESSVVSGAERVYTGEPIDLTLTNADIIDVLRLFSELTGLNIAIDPGVSGTVTVDFTGVPWDQALELILRQNNLGYRLEGNVMRIGTVQRLSQEEAQLRQLAEEQRLNVQLNTVIKYLSYAKAEDIQGILSQMLTPRGKIVVDPRTNQLIITEIPENLQTVLNLIETVDIPTPQVIIEARIVETTKTFARQLGITWGFTGSLDPALGTGTGLSFPNTVDVIGGPFDLGVGNPVLDISLGNVLGTFSLDVLLTAAESEGLVKVVSAPRVTTQDNESAEIQSGVQIPVQTRVNFTTTVQYIDATLRLTVTPQVTAEGTVIMEIEVQKVEPALGLTVVGGTNSPLITRRANTKVMVRDGGTTVIGGIYQATDNDSQSRVPFLHNIPILGNLFKNNDINKRHDELLIFITPRIVRNP